MSHRTRRTTVGPTGEAGVRSRRLHSPQSGELRAKNRGSAELDQDGRDLDGPVLALMVLEQRDQRAPDSRGRAVEGVHVRRLAALGPVADVEPARLEVG